MSEKIKKPPDINYINQNVFRIIKCPLKSVLKEYDKLHPIIDNCVKEINQFVIIGYQFIRLYLLDKYNKNEDLPIVDKQFILDVLKTIGKSETNRGKQKLEDKIINKNIKDNLKLFYDDVFSKIVPEKLSYTNKTHILEQTSKEMITCLETNISTHFIKHLFKYINCIFKEPKTKIIKQEKDKDKRKESYKELNEDLRNLKSDLINNKIKDSKEEYHKWINENSKFLFPLKISKSVAYDVKIHPEKYIKYSIYINKKLEELGKRPYQFIPQRNNIIPKNIILNTSGITDLICSKYEKLFDYSKSELILNCKKYQQHIWSKILKLEKNSIFKNKNYIFYNQIITDGFSCSLLFILKKYKDKKYGEKLPKTILEDNSFRKIEDLTKEECNKYLTNKYKLVSVDPGKIRIVSMIDENNNFYKYSACRRRFETYTKRYNEIINKEKIKNNIIEKETKLSLNNSRTLKIEDYKNFVINKNKLNDEVKDFYNKLLFRKLNFRRYIKTKQSEEKMLNEIEDKFLTKEDKKNKRKILLLHGDYSRTSQMKGCIPSPNIGFKKILNKRFDIVEINEYNTSKLYNKTLKELTNVNIRKKKHKRYLHEILTLKEDPERCIYVNRDKNACKNILNIGKEYLKTQTRKKEFIREKKKKDNLINKKDKKIVKLKKVIVV
jgi:hypothetical protein